MDEIDTGCRSVVKSMRGGQEADDKPGSKRRQTRHSGNSQPGGEKLEALTEEPGT